MLLLYILLLVSMFLYLFLRFMKYDINRSYVILMFAILGIMMMFRAESVGNDTFEYKQLFYLFNSIDMSNLSTRYEIGYIILNKLLGCISSNPQIIFIFTGAFVAFTFGRFILKYSTIPWLSVVMFIALQFFDLSMSGMRQILAISILTLAYDQLVNQKLFKFVFIVLIATAMHISSIIFLLFYPLKKSKANFSFFIRLSMLTIIIYVFFDTIILSLFEQILPNHIKYFTQSGLSFSNEPKLATAITIIYWGAMYITGYVIFKRKFYQNRYEDNYSIFSKKEQDNFNLQSIMLLIGIVMLILALHGTILTRFKYILLFVLLVYYPNAINSIRNDILKTQLLIGSIAIFMTSITVIYLLRPEWQSTFPYQFFWQ